MESEPFTIFRVVEEFVVRLSAESLLLELRVMIPAELKAIVASSVGPGGEPVLQFEPVSQSPPLVLIH